MSGFAAHWLDLREPADAGARDEALAAHLSSALPSRPLRILDLGSGTGANARWLAPHLGGDQHWWVVDDDEALLSALAARMSQKNSATVGGGEAGLLTVTPLGMNLASGLETLDFSLFDLVTASALLDLVSAPWAETLAAGCGAAGVPVLVVLTVDGAIAWEPADAEDERVRNLFLRHQRTDKGFGPALGPEATASFSRALEGRGYGIWTAPSPWRLGDGDSALQMALIAGFAESAQEMAPGDVTAIKAWATRRRHHVTAGRSRLVVGHRDLLALPRLPPVSAGGGPV